MAPVLTVSNKNTREVGGAVAPRVEDGRRVRCGFIPLAWRSCPADIIPHRAGAPKLHARHGVCSSKFDSRLIQDE
eukprot:2416434-Prymnesium_polylepis.2